MKHFASCPADIQAAFSYAGVASGWFKAGVQPMVSIDNLITININI